MPLRREFKYDEDEDDGENEAVDNDIDRIEVQPVARTRTQRSDRRAALLIY